MTVVAEPSPILLMRLIADSDSLEEARGRAAEARLSGADLARLTPRTFETVKAVLASVDHHEQGASLSAIGAAFDRAAAVSPEGGVALYSLGDPALLAAITGEVVGWMSAEGLIGPASRVLEVGCGIGRYLVALAPRVALAVGLDISAKMVTEAGVRCAGLANVLAARGSGRDLACIAGESVDVVLFADSFPYLVQAARGLPETHIAEAARVLRPGGRLLILNYSYRGDPDRDRREVDVLARASGLMSVALHPPHFESWDAAAYLFARGR